MMTKQVKVQFSFRKKPHDQPVHVKLDGGRFDLERTLKFNVKSKYNVEVTIRPALALQSVMIMGQSATLLVKQLENDFVVYKAEWLTTGIDKCQKGKREKVPVILQIKNAGELRAEWQCKFYSESEGEHTCWGDVCTYIEYECKAEENSLVMDITKETYR